MTSADEAKTKDETVEVPVQIKGKIKAKIQVPPDCSQADLLAAAKAEPAIAKLIEGKEIIKEIAVPGRMVNLVVK